MNRAPGKKDIGDTTQVALEAMSVFRNEINRRSFTEPRAFSESILGYVLGAVAFTLLAAVSSSLLPLLILPFLLGSAIVFRVFSISSALWRYYEFVVVCSSLVVITFFFETALIASVVIAIGYMHRNSFIVGAKTASRMSLPVIAAFSGVYAAQYLTGEATVSPENIGVMLVVFLFLLVMAFAESIVIGSTVEQMTAGHIANSKISGSQNAVFESIGEAIIGVDTQLKISFVNRRAVELLGVESAQLVGKSSADLGIFFDKEGKAVSKELNPFSLAVGNIATIHYRISTLNKIYMKGSSGDLSPVGLTVSPIMINGVVDGAVAVLQDIAEDSAVDKGKSEFVALASHHLRTPISTLRWNLERLLSKDTSNLTERQLSALTRIESANNRILRLINNLLSVSRIETNTQRVASEEVDIPNIINKVQDLLAATKKTSGSKVEVIRRGTITPIQASDAYIAQLVLENLMSNALHYGDGAPIQVEIRAVAPAAYQEVYGGQALMAPAGGVLVLFEDEGIGISRKDATRIFEKFFRAENSAQTYADGTGIGLYLSRHLIGLVGGKIWFESNNKKTTFYAFFPSN